jgi:hypothetical protein
MLKRLKNIALFIALSGVLTGFLVEHMSVLQHADSICLKKSSDSEKKDTSESKKFGKDDPNQPEDLPQSVAAFLEAASNCCLLGTNADIPNSGNYVSILTPPPERA